MRKLIFILLPALIFSFSSCSKSEKLLKTTDNETKYKLAMQYYSDGKYRLANKFFEPILLAVRGTERDDSVNFYYAKSFYLINDPFSAEYYFDIFKRTFPRSVFAQEASFLYASCIYRQTNRPELDQTPTIKAINAYNEYLYNFPKSNAENEAKAQGALKNLTQRLIDKSFNEAMLYYNIEDYRSAIVSMKNHLKDYPDSNHREKALFSILKSSYLYATKSKHSKRRERYQSTIDEYLNFKSEYPNSVHNKEAEDMYKIAVKATEFDASKILEKN